jgi:hypothetical protein
MFIVQWGFAFVFYLSIYCTIVSLTLSVTPPYPLKASSGAVRRKQVDHGILTNLKDNLRFLESRVRLLSKR